MTWSRRSPVSSSPRPCRTRWSGPRTDRTGGHEPAGAAPADGARQHLRRGKIDAALANYFREGNLAALRELALLWLADRVEEGLDRYRGARHHRHLADPRAGRGRAVRRPRVGGPAAPGRPDRLPVPAGSGWPCTSAAATADRGDARPRWNGCGGGRGPSAAASTVVGHDAADGLLDFARGVNATQVLLGASRRGRLSTLLQPGVGEEAIARSGDIDVHVVTHDSPAAPPERRHGADAEPGPAGLRSFVAVLGTALLALGCSP